MLRQWLWEGGFTWGLTWGTVLRPLRSAREENELGRRLEPCPQPWEAWPWCLLAPPRFPGAPLLPGAGGVSWCHQHCWTKQLPPYPLRSKAALLLISSKNPKFYPWAVFFFFTLNKCLRRSIFLQLMISAVSNSKWGLHPSPQNALLHHSLLVRAQKKSGPSTFKWSGYIVWQLVPLHLPLCCGRRVLWKQLDGEKEFKCWTPNQCLHFQFSTDGSPQSACTYINKKPFCHAGFAFPGALW